MRPEGLREATRRAAASGDHKLATRLSGGEQRNRKRMAEVGASTTAIRLVVLRTTSSPTRAEGTAGHRLGCPVLSRGEWLIPSVFESIDARTSSAPPRLPARGALLRSPGRSLTCKGLRPQASLD
jgi:hypothetical protein